MTRPAARGGALPQPAEAVIFYAPDAFDTSRRRLMGRQSAGDGFIRAYLRYAAARGVNVYADPASQRHFSTRFGGQLGEAASIRRIGLADFGKLSAVGTLMLADPGVVGAAWR